MCPVATPSHRASTAPSLVLPDSGVVLGQASLLLHHQISRDGSAFANLRGSFAGFMSLDSNKK